MCRRFNYCFNFRDLLIGGHHRMRYVGLSIGIHYPWCHCGVCSDSELLDSGNYLYWDFLVNVLLCKRTIKIQGFHDDEEGLFIHRLFLVVDFDLSYNYVSLPKRSFLRCKRIDLYPQTPLSWSYGWLDGRTMWNFHQRLLSQRQSSEYDLPHSELQYHTFWVSPSKWKGES